MSRRAFLERTGTVAGAIALPLTHLQAAAPTSAADEIQKKIASAIPAKALAVPRKPRKLLIFELNVNYGGHGSIPTASQAFTLMGQRTGAFETVISRDPQVFKPESLRQFDAVFFNNNVGNLFADVTLRESLAEFIHGGGGMMGVHGTSVAFTQWPGAKEDWPEFGAMIGARGANHRESTEHVVIKLDDPTHPINQTFNGQGFDYRDEFFRVHEPYSRKKLRILLSIDNEKTDLAQGLARGKIMRADNDYAVAWIRQYGRGRTFYCTIAHNPYVFWDPQILPFYLAAAQFVLGDLDAPTTPSAKLTPAIRVQERLGWRLSLNPTGHKSTLLETIDKTASVNQANLTVGTNQTISTILPKCLGEELTAEEARDLRMKLDSAGVRLLTCHCQQIPKDQAKLRQTLDSLRKMGIETVMGPADESSIGILEKVCTELDLRYAVTTFGNQNNPKDLLKLCQRHTRVIGIYGCADDWVQSSLAPEEIIQQLRERLIVVKLPAKLEQWSGCLRAIQQSGVKPCTFELSGAVANVKVQSEKFNQICLDLASGGRQ